MLKSELLRRLSEQLHEGELSFHKQMWEREVSGRIHERDEDEKRQFKREVCRLRKKVDRMIRKINLFGWRSWLSHDL